MKKYGLNYSQIQKYFYHQILRKKMFDKISSSVSDTAEQVWLRSILVSSQDDANKVFSRLNSGESWDMVANEMSLDNNTKAMGGDLGWFPKGVSATVTEVESAAFEMNVGEIRIVQSSGNWYVIQLLGKDSKRPLSDNHLMILKEAAFNQWLQDLKIRQRSRLLIPGRIGCHPAPLCLLYRHREFSKTIL